MKVFCIIFTENDQTFDRRLKIISTEYKERISTIGDLFVFEELVKHMSLQWIAHFLKSKGKVWHTSSMKEGIVPCSGIDTDAIGDAIPRVGYLDINFI